MGLLRDGLFTHSAWLRHCSLQLGFCCFCYDSIRYFPVLLQFSVPFVNVHGYTDPGMNTLFVICSVHDKGDRSTVTFSCPIKAQATAVDGVCTSERLVRDSVYFLMTAMRTE